MSNLALSRRIWRWVIFCKMPPSLIFIVDLISRKKFFIFASLWELILSRAPIKDATRWWGSELQRNIASSTRFEEMDTDIGTCFRIQIVVVVPLKVSSLTQIDSKSNIVKFLKNFFVHSCGWYPKSPASQREFLGFDIRSVDRHFSLVHCM